MKLEQRPRKDATLCGGSGYSICFSGNKWRCSPLQRAFTIRIVLVVTHTSSKYLLQLWYTDGRFYSNLK